MSSRQQQSQRLGDSVWGRMPKVNAELFTLTYGALVAQVRKTFLNNEAKKEIVDTGR